MRHGEQSACPSRNKTTDQTRVTPDTLEGRVIGRLFLQLADRDAYRGSVQN